MNIVTIKHQSHLVAATIDTGNATPKSGFQILYAGKQQVGQHRAFRMVPQPFNQVQARTIWRQPEDFDLIPMRSEPLPDGLGLMKPPIATTVNESFRVST